MRTLTEVYEKVASQDVELEKQAAELVKQAEEEDAAGRIMARGFADELSKLAESPFALSTPGQTGAGSRYGNTPGRQAQRPPRAPGVAPAGDTNAPGQAFNARKTKMNPVTGASSNPGAGAAPPAPKPKVGAGARMPGAPKPPGGG